MGFTAALGEGARMWSLPHRAWLCDETEGGKLELQAMFDCKDDKYLVGGLKHFLFFHILRIIIPID